MRALTLKKLLEDLPFSGIVSCSLEWIYLILALPGKSTEGQSGSRSSQSTVPAKSWAVSLTIFALVRKRSLGI